MMDGCSLIGTVGESLFAQPFTPFLGRSIFVRSGQAVYGYDPFCGSIEPQELLLR